MLTYRLKTVTVKAQEDEGLGYCTTPRGAVALLRTIFGELDQDREHFAVLTLNAKGKVSGYKVLYSGTATAVMVEPADVMRTALLLGGVSFLVAHNHPSGNPTPSAEDRALTRRLLGSGQLLGLTMADHIVLGEDSHHSFRAAGELE